MVAGWGGVVGGDGRGCTWGWAEGIVGRSGAGGAREEHIGT